MTHPSRPPVLPSFAELTKGMPDVHNDAIYIAPLKAFATTLEPHAKAFSVQDAVKAPRGAQPSDTTVSARQGHAPSTTLFQEALSNSQRLVREDDLFAATATSAWKTRKLRRVPKDAAAQLVIFGFSDRQIQDLSRQRKAMGAARVIRAIIEATPALLETKFTTDHIVDLSHHTPRGLFKTLPEITDKLVAAGFSPEHIMTVAKRRNGFANLSALQHYGPPLMYMGLKAADIAHIISRRDPVNVLDTLLDHGRALLDMGCSVTLLSNMAKHHQGAEKITLLAQHYPSLRARNITNMALERHSGQSLDAFQKWLR